MLKPFVEIRPDYLMAQPPLRGCVLKPTRLRRHYPNQHAAASARLCVETTGAISSDTDVKAAAASARLCVETQSALRCAFKLMAAASARLCVETIKWAIFVPIFSRQPPLRGCVLKHH